MDPSGQPLSAVQRRKQRRLRSWWRHEQQLIAAALATSLHHSALRGQKKARAGEEESESCTTRPRSGRLPSPAGALQPVRRARRYAVRCSRGASAAGTGGGATLWLRDGLLAGGPDSGCSRAAFGRSLYLCGAGAGDRSTSSRSWCRGACGSCPGSAVGLPVVETQLSGSFQRS